MGLSCSDFLQGQTHGPKSCDPAICQWKGRCATRSAEAPLSKHFGNRTESASRKMPRLDPSCEKKGSSMYVVEGSTDGADSDAVERRTLSAPGACAFCKAPHSNIEVLERKPDLSPMQKNPMGGPHTPWRELVAGRERKATNAAYPRVY